MNHRHVQLTCGECHFLIPGMNPQNPEAMVCRRHPKQVTLQLVEVAPANQETIELPGLQPMQAAQAAQNQMAHLQGNPVELPEAAACGDFMDKRGRTYWVCYMEKVNKL